MSSQEQRRHKSPLDRIVVKKLQQVEACFTVTIGSLLIALVGVILQVIGKLDSPDLWAIIVLLATNVAVLTIGFFKLRAVMIVNETSDRNAT